MKHSRNGATQTREPGRLTPARARKIFEAALIFEAYLSGNNMQQVCEIVEQKTGHRYSHSYIHKVITENVRECVARKDDYMQNHIAVELAKLNRLEATYWDAWERSKLADKSTTKKERKGKEGTRLGLHEKETTERQQVGDPEFLKGVKECHKLRVELLGPAVPAVAVQINNTNNGDQAQSTTIVRRISFRTRVTTAQPQVIQDIEP